jgi:hypothetical protein
MAEGSATKLATILWFVAGALALAGAAVTYARSGDIKWHLVAAGIFMVGMGVYTLSRSKVGGA